MMKSVYWSVAWIFPTNILNELHVYLYCGLCSIVPCFAPLLFLVAHSCKFSFSLNSWVPESLYVFIAHGRTFIRTVGDITSEAVHAACTTISWKPQGHTLHGLNYEDCSHSVRKQDSYYSAKNCIKLLETCYFIIMSEHLPLKDQILYKCRRFIVCE